MITEIPVLKKLNQKGQGFVEYLLLVVIIISFALAISARLFKPFNEWAKNYIGEYIYCLLDAGELPSMGGEEKVEECDRGFKAFTVGEGRASNEKDSQNQGGVGGRSGKGSGRSNAGDVVAANRRGRKGSALGEGFDNAAGKKSNVIDVGAANTSNQRNNRFYSNYGSRGSPPKPVQYYGLTGLMAQEAARIQKREEKITTIARTETTQGFVRGRTKKFPVETPQSKKTDGPEIGGFGMDWGGWLRSLLIIVIIVVLVLFIAGQMMQISKSMEKE